MDKKKRFEVLLNYQEIENILKKCRLTDSLLAVSTESQKIFTDHKYFNDIGNRKVHPWVLAYVAKILLKVTSDFNRVKAMDEDDYLKIADIYYNALNPIIKEIPNLAPVFTLATTYEQLFWQQYIANLIPRYYLIFSHRRSETGELSKIRDDIESTFVQMTGIRIIDYMRLGLFIFSTMKSSGIYKASNILEGEIDKYRDTCTKDKLQSFLDFVSVESPDFRKSVETADEANPVFQKYTLNPLFAKPIVHISDLSLAPIPRLLIDKVSEGIYFDLFNYIKDKTGNPQTFPNEFGHLFDDYVGLLLTSKYEIGDTLYNGDEYAYKGYNGKRCDWIVFEGDSIVLLETKSARFPRYVIESMDIEVVREFIRSRFVGAVGVQQLLECRGYFESEFPKKKIHTAIVSNDIFPHFNFLRGYFEDHDDRIAEIERAKLQFMNILELEMLISSKKYGLSTVLERKNQDEPSKLSWFGSFMARLPGADFEGTPELLDRTFNEMLHW